MLQFAFLFVLAISWATAVRPPTCPPGVIPVQCLVDPCRVKTCPMYPDAECVANYCYGCNADFYVNGQIVSCGIQIKATTKPWKRCPPGVPIVNCIVNPCDVKTCPRYPNAECRANYCGGCNAVFYVDGQKVRCKKPSSEYQ